MDAVLTSADQHGRNMHPQTIATQSTPSPEASGLQRPYCGCAYLQTIRSQFEDYSTTQGAYLDAIFTHREVFYSYPAAHQDCAAAFSDLAYMLETRAWRADREADTEAVMAFRNEAWIIASTFAPPKTREPSFQQPAVCVMPMMW